MTLTIRELAERAKRSSRRWRTLSRGTKDDALGALANALRRSAARIIEKNSQDVALARTAGLPEALVDRLVLDHARLQATIDAVEHVISLEDPVGSRHGVRRRPNGLLIAQQRVPLGVVAIVYESRPNVTVDSAVLCLKTGNAVLLRGGKEAALTNRALVECMAAALVERGLNEGMLGWIEPGDRQEIQELVSLEGLVDLVIPRGGEGLIRFVTEHARVPVIQHYKGVCHLFLDAGCDAEMALGLVLDGKVQRPGVCNALECLLVDASDAERLLPGIASALVSQGVELRGCPETLKLVPGARPAADSDWGREFLEKILAVRLVAGLEGALEHVERYGSKHTEAICTQRLDHATRWLDEVDASCVLVNASTRFNDGGQLGLGAEIGISTSKLHAYGPMGLESLTASKWVVIGEGQIRA